MTVENISWSISTKECCRPRRGLNSRPPGLKSDGASNWATEAGWGSCPIPMHPLTLVEADNETLLPVGGYLAIANDCSCEVTDHGGAHVTGCLYNLHRYAWWARCFASLHLRDSLLNHINGDWDGTVFHWWFDRQVVWVLVKLNTEKPLVVL